MDNEELVGNLKNQGFEQRGSDFRWVGKDCRILLSFRGNKELKASYIQNNKAQDVIFVDIPKDLLGLEVWLGYYLHSGGRIDEKGTIGIE